MSNSVKEKGCGYFGTGTGVGVWIGGGGGVDEGPGRIYGRRGRPGPKASWIDLNDLVSAPGDPQTGLLPIPLQSHILEVRWHHLSKGSKSE